MSIVLGLGSGRCGTMSLANLINAQKSAVCFHELNPSCMSWGGSYGTVASLLREFEAILAGGPVEHLTVDRTTDNNKSVLERLNGASRVECLGDLGFYYLPYVERVLRDFPDVRFPCLRRGREATVHSFMKKMTVAWTRTPKSLFRMRPRQKNHFVIHDGSKWDLDLRWDKCFPKYETNSLSIAIGLYWDEYYKEAERLEALHSNVRIFDTDSLNDPTTQGEILDFCGVVDSSYMEVHSNTSW